MKNNGKLYLFLILVIVLIFLFNSCAMKNIKLSENRKRLKIIIEKINSYNDGIKSFKGNGYAIIKDGKSTKTFRLETIFSDDFDSYKILIKDFVFKKPIVVLIKKGEESVFLYDYVKKRKDSFLDTSEIFERVLNFHIPEGNTFVQTLGLRVPILENVKPQLLDSDSVQFNFENSREIIHFLDEVPDEISYTNNNANMIVKYSNEKEINNKKLPSKIIIIIGKMTLEINYKEIEINGDYSAKIKLDK